MGAQFGWPAYVLSRTSLAFQQLQEQLASQGIEIGIADFGGFRTPADTTRILDYRQTEYDQAIAVGSIPSSMTIDQFRPIAPYGHSFHDYGAAFDIRLKSIPDGMTTDQAFTFAGALAPSLGLRWGGTFHNGDARHFELDVSLSEARSLFQTETGTVDTSGAAGAGGDASAMLGLGPDDVGDDSGEGAIEDAIAADDAMTGWILVGVALVSGLVLAIMRRR